MNKKTAIICCTLAALAGLRPAAFGEELGRYADNKIYAQTLVNKTLADNPDLLVLGLHTIAPGNRDYTMIASNLNSIGEKDGDDDISVAVEHKIILAPNLKTHDRIEVQIPMQSATGEFIGSLVCVFPYAEGTTDRVKLLTKALAVSKELSRQIPDKHSLFTPTN